MAHTIKDVLLTEANHIKSIAQDVAFSGAYCYPIKGIIYMTTHKSLLQPFLSRFTQTFSLGLGVTSVMFFFTYLPQVTLMAFTSGPLAPISAFFLVLSESSTITNFLSRSFVLQDALVDTFDGTLVARGQEALVAQGRQLNSSSSSSSGSGDSIARLGRMIMKPLARMHPRALLRSLMYLPLNFIPVVGTALYVYVQAKKMGPGLHARYFQLKGWDEKRRAEWVDRLRGSYTGLGMGSSVLEMVPFASILFAFTNTVGAALWAADLEKQMQ